MGERICVEFLLGHKENGWGHQLVSAEEEGHEGLRKTVSATFSSVSLRTPQKRGEETHA